MFIKPTYAQMDSSKQLIGTGNQHRKNEILNHLMNLLKIKTNLESIVLKIFNVWAIVYTPLEKFRQGKFVPISKHYEAISPLLLLCKLYEGHIYGIEIEIIIKCKAMCLQRIVIDFLSLFIIEDWLEMSNMSRYYCFKSVTYYKKIII